jgi:tetratricopeptide (TPR) repeat protein
LHERLTLLHQEEDAERFAQALFGLSVVALQDGDVVAARGFVERCLVIQRAERKPLELAAVLNLRARVAAVQGEDIQARDAYEEALSISRELGARAGIATVLSGMATLAIAQNELVSAGPLLEESLSICRDLNQRLILARTLCDLGRIRAERNDVREACANWRESLAIQRELGLSRSSELMHLAHIAYQRGNWKVAAKSYGALESHTDADDVSRWPSMRRRIEAEWAEMQARLGAERFQKTFNLGADTELDAALSEALAEICCDHR